MTTISLDACNSGVPEPDPNSVLAKVQRVLTAFDATDRVLSLTQLAQRTRVPKASVHRLCQELVRLRFLERAAGGYQLGSSLFALGSRVQHFRHLRATSEPFLCDLFLATRETVHLAIRDGLNVFYICKIAGSAQAQAQHYSGASGELPLHSTATGKVLLAFSANPQLLIAALAQRGLGRLTVHTVSTPAMLHRQVMTVRQTGFATEIEETGLGWMSISVPVKAEDGTSTVAVSVTVPTVRRDLRRYLPDLQAAASRIADSLLSQPPFAGAELPGLRDRVIRAIHSPAGAC